MDLVDRILERVKDLPPYADNQPDMLLVTERELRTIIGDELLIEAHRTACAKVPKP